jgi:hypothetical protein
MTDSSPNPKALIEHVAKALVAAPKTTWGA